MTCPRNETPALGSEATFKELLRRLGRLCECLEPAPSLEDWMLEIEMRHIEQRGRIVCFPTDWQRVRVRYGEDGEGFWEALADVYDWCTGGDDL